MGNFAQYLGKTAYNIIRTIGKTVTKSKQIGTSCVSASIGSVLANLLGEEEIGDKFESSNNKKNDNKTAAEKKQTTKNNIPDESSKLIQTPVEKNNSTKKEQSVSKNEAITSTQTVDSKFKTTKKVESPISDEELNKMRANLASKCEAENINFAELIVKMTALTGKSLAEFHKTDKNFQMMLLSYISESIDRINKANLKDVNKLEAVVTDAALMYEFITHDKNGETYDIESMPPEQLRERRLLFEELLKKRREEKMAKIESLPEEERAAALKELKTELAGYRKHIFEELNKKITFENALELLLIVSVKDLGDAAKELMESYPIEIREKIANTMQNYDTFREYIKLHKADCDKLTENEIAAIEQYHKIFGTYKTKENFEDYEAKFQESRRNGEFSEDINRGSAMGIGEAAYANIFMTSEEKETFLQKWVSNNNDLLSDADMAKVESSASKYIQELLKKNPKIKENFAQVKHSIKEIVEKTLKRTFEEKIEKSKEHSNKNKQQEANAEIRKFITAPSDKVLKINKEVISFAQQYIKAQAEKFEKPAIKKTPEEVSTALLLGIIDEKTALANLDNSEHKFIKMCVQNPRLASIYDERIDLYIKTETDKDKLQAIAKVAPHDIVLKIVHNMKGNKEKFTQNLIKKHEITYDTKVIIEKYSKQSAE